MMKYKSRPYKDLALRQDLFEPIDIHFAYFMERMSGKENSVLWLSAALLSRNTRDGHICLELDNLAGKALGGDDDIHSYPACPALDDWLEQLRSTPVVGKPPGFVPLVLDPPRLYLWRYWNYETKLASKLLLMGSRECAIDLLLLKEGLERLFPSAGPAVIDWQKNAAALCLKKCFSVVSGGPGTGKTTTVTRILALLLEQDQNLSIALCAPTGKAAERLRKTLQSLVPVLDCAERIKELIPAEASTIHRLLGYIPGSSRFRYRQDNPLPYDAVVVDEASMVDLALMSKLVQALKDDSRLILLGDKDQLASVEAGYVLGDICDTGYSHGYSTCISRVLKDLTGCDVQGGAEPGMQDSIVELKKNYRFKDDSPLKKLSTAVNAGDAADCLAVLKSVDSPGLRLKRVPQPDDLFNALNQAIVDGYKLYIDASDMEQQFKLFSRFQVLCALRKGPFGAENINAVIEDILLQHGLIRAKDRQYHGRPVLVTTNDYSLRLFNGDVGIILHDPDVNDLRAVFPSADGQFRKLSPGRLPDHETAFAMTVHKSQGSEFDDVLLILPDRDSPVLTRELIYTGITRARNELEILMDEAVFRTALGRRIVRSSGLRDHLWAGH